MENAERIATNLSRSDGLKLREELERAGFELHGNPFFLGIHPGNMDRNYPRDSQGNPACLGCIWMHHVYIENTGIAALQPYQKTLRAIIGEGFKGRGYPRR